MGPTIEKLLKKLENYELKSYIFSNDVIIDDVKFLSKQMNSYDCYTLYISGAADLTEAFPVKGIKNLLIIADCTTSFEFPADYECNLIMLYGDIKATEILSFIHETIGNSKKIDAYSTKFINALVEDKGIQHIIDLGFELLGNPMFVTDAIHKVLGFTKDVQVDDPDWHRIVENGYVSFNIATNSKMKEVMEKILSSNSPVISPSRDNKTEILRTSIRVDNKITGHLIIPGYYKPFSEFDIEVAALLGNILALEMQKSKFIHSTKGFMDEYFITDLLDGKIKAPGIIKHEMRFLNWKLRENLYVLVIRAKNHETPNVSPYQIMDSVKKLVAGTISVFYNEDIVSVISRDVKSLQFETELKALVKLLKEKQLHGGISRCFHSLMDIKDHYKQAANAIELGSSMDNKKFIYLYEDYAVYHLLASCSSSENLNTFCHPSLSLLSKYDYKNGTEFMSSLNCYLVNNKNLVECGNILHIHRNTMSYRIKKIEEITDLDLKDDNISFHLLLSFKILEFISKR